jgi:carboxyl-terminal processing protease
MMNRRLPLYFSIFLAIGLLTGFLLRVDAPLLSIGSEGRVATRNGAVDQVLSYIEARYVDEADRDELYQAAIESILDDLDPHSSYIPREEVQALTENMEGNFVGIGIEYLVVDDTIVVVSALPEGPADRAGVRAGDRIIYVADSLVTGVTERDIDPASLMRGEEGSSIEVTVARDELSELTKFDIVRAPIPVNSVDAAYTINERTAYVKINRFSKTTYTEFLAALEESLEKPDARDLIIDLRGNPGGFLQEATKLLSELFTERGLLLVYTEGLHSTRQSYKTSGRARYNIQNVAILVDGGSASASEIVAGAVQDHDRGIVVGRRTFGKGLVQEQYPLADGSELRLTVARYYIPSNRSIQREYEGVDDYRGDLNRRYASGELTGRTGVAIDSALTFYTDNGHPVYGGGGITPDHFVPLDSSLNNPDFLHLRQQINGYIFTYLRKHPEVRNFADLATYRRKFRTNRAEVLDDLRELAREDYPDLQTDELAPQLRTELALYFRARLARQLFGPTAFYEIYNEGDDIVQEAVQLLGASNPLAAARGVDMANSR